MRRIPVALWIFAVLLQAVAFCQETTLHNFTGGTDGANPLGDLLYDSASGLVYGTTNKGGGSAACSKGCGTVFAVQPDGSGYTVLYAFLGGTDGANPQAGLTMDSSGNLYGTTYNGGAHGLGAVYKLTALTGGAFSESILYSFAGGTADGEHPLAHLAIDSSGNLYGTTYSGGRKKKGVVFELTSSGTESILYNFTGADGSSPRAGVVFDASGNLWGTTSTGGAFNLGTVFQLTGVSGVWSQSFLYSFTGLPTGDGANPYAKVTLDTSGNVYGTTKYGGPGCTFTSKGCGAVFELQPSTGGYTESLIYSFTGGLDGAEPIAKVTLALDPSGNSYLFGVANGAGTIGGKCPSMGCGTFFELCSMTSTCGSTSAWTEYTLADFAGKSNGRNPAGGVVVYTPFTPSPSYDPFGHVLGHEGCPSGCGNTGSSGGSSGNGTYDTSP
jgi:uncharacterized repeat protein (TIGR03803 family)